MRKYFTFFAMFDPEETNYKTNQSIEKRKFFNRISMTRENNFRD